MERSKGKEKAGEKSITHDQCQCHKEYQHLLWLPRKWYPETELQMHAEADSLGRGDRDGTKTRLELEGQTTGNRRAPYPYPERF